MTFDLSCLCFSSICGLSPLCLWLQFASSIWSWQFGWPSHTDTGSRQRPPSHMNSSLEQLSEKTQCANLNIVAKHIQEWTLVLPDAGYWLCPGSTALYWAVKPLPAMLPSEWKVTHTVLLFVLAVGGATLPQNLQGRHLFLISLILVQLWIELCAWAMQL